MLGALGQTKKLFTQCVIGVWNSLPIGILEELILMASLPHYVGMLLQLALLLQRSNLASVKGGNFVQGYEWRN